MEKISLLCGQYCSQMTRQDSSYNNYKVELEAFCDEEIEVNGINYHINTHRHQAAAVMVDKLSSKDYPTNNIQEVVTQNGESYDVVFLFVIGSEFCIHVPNSVQDVYVEKFPIQRPYGEYRDAPWKVGDQRFYVSHNHPYLQATSAGSLYTKDGKTLLHFNPRGMDGYSTKEELLPEVTTIAPGALAGSGITDIPQSVTILNCDLAYANLAPTKLVLEGNHTALVLPKYYDNKICRICAYVQDIEIKTANGEVMTMEQKNEEKHFFFRSPKLDATPTVGHIVSLTQAPNRTWEGVHKPNCDAWAQTIKINALAVGAIEPITIDTADEPKCHKGTKIYLLGYGLAGLNMGEQKALLDEMGKADYVCAFEVYEDPDTVYEKLLKAGWQGNI